MPTGFAFLLLILGIGLTTYFIQQRTSLTGQASPEKEPQNVVISNIDDNSFTVNFTTTSPSSAAVSVTDGSSNPKIAYDEGSTAGKQIPTLSHLIRITDLKPNSLYRFSILSDGETYLKDGQQYTVNTGPTLDQSDIVQVPINGSVLQPDGQPATETLIELSIPGAQLLTVLTNSDGQYAIPLENLRNAQLNSYKRLSANDTLTITALRGDLKTTIDISANNASEIPPVTLSESYNFTGQAAEEISTPSSELKVPAEGTSNGRVTITTPTKNQSFVDSRPRFSGSAFPSGDVKITINPTKTATTVKSTGGGFWSYRPEEALLPGNYTITVQSADQFGISTSVSQSFTIFSSGSQLSPNASQSATTPTPTKKPTSTPTPTPTRIPSPTTGITSTITTTPIPSSSPTPLPTNVPTVAITSTPTPTVIAKPTATIAPTGVGIITATPPPPPVSGAATTTVVLTTISLLLIFAGSALLFLL